MKYYLALKDSSFVTLTDCTEDGEGLLETAKRLEPLLTRVSFITINDEGDHEIQQVLKDGSLGPITY